MSVGQRKTILTYSRNIINFNSRTKSFEPVQEKRVPGGSRFYSSINLEVHGVEKLVLTEFELVIGLREVGYSNHDIQERLGRNVSTVHDCWEKWSKDGIASRCSDSVQTRGSTDREDRRIRRTAVVHSTASPSEIPAAVGTTVTQRTVINRLLQEQLQASACIPLTPSHCRLRCQWCKARAHWGMDLLCFLMKSGSALEPVMSVCSTGGAQGNACNQNVCILDTLDLLLESKSGVQFPIYDCWSTLVVIPNALTANLWVSLVIQPIVLSFMNSIQRGVIQQDNARLHTTVVTQRALPCWKCGLALRDHQICLQLIPNRISLDDNSSSTANIDRLSIDTTSAKSMELTK
ncbi:HTH_Tnp_Tc3_2 domain-containing protein [Trichonephila clavipes]|uniref:HTH_Tnp_Tc3_2 domain-containing protein n=1 Tax=Trichonephila clavipes TaxID=2585209 RepID=A0A8X6R3Q7_TRICX|nr:HTH_Tnp_Tc3_2 domain-containing protein [Trichonephila clavipes]